ncbi:MAG: hypothetical protein IJV31_02490 [Clostridia bacterium]|nr:hypothetical protein [Clostridia bacterium]
MLAKYWKKIGILILIIACIFNIMFKLVKRVSLNAELNQTSRYIEEQFKNKNSSK